MIFEGLLGADATGSGGADDPVQLALARLRQLAAHEVGHTLGLDHNFAASALGRVSVMDYPAPLVRLRDDGSLDASEAYGVGVGAWDVEAIRYAYSEFPPGTDEDAALDAIVQQSLAAGLVFLTDQDARPSGAAHPLASLWDNGANPVAELEQVMAVRHAALARFGAANVARGRPLAELQETLAPLYFYHRYQLAAAAKVLGGLEYRHALRATDSPRHVRWPRSGSVQRCGPCSTASIRRRSISGTRFSPYCFRAPPMKGTTARCSPAARRRRSTPCQQRPPPQVWLSTLCCRVSGSRA